MNCGGRFKSAFTQGRNGQLRRADAASVDLRAHASDNDPEREVVVR